MDKWAHLGHALGECWIDNNKNIAFVHIPKNASSFVKGCLLSTGKFTHSSSLVQADRYLVTLRDPLERWISGITQFMSNPINQHLTIEQLTDRWTFDDHTELQTYFLKGIDLEQCDFIRVDDNLRTNIKSWMAVNGYYVTDIDQIPNINTGDHQAQKQYANILDFDQDLVLKLTEHYAKDYELINRVKFYGT
jgi:hypothetical protein